MSVIPRTLLIALLVFAAAPAFAQSGAETAAEPVAVDDAGDDEAAWVKRLEEGAARLSAAQQRVDELEHAKGRGASRRYPRGEAKEQYLEQLAEARAELSAAREEMPELLEDARRAGVMPGVLDRYETAAAAAAADGDTDD